METYIVMETGTLVLIETGLSYKEAKELEFKLKGKCSVVSTEVYRVLVGLRNETEGRRHV